METQGCRYNSSPSELSCSPGEQLKRSRVLCLLPCTVSQLVSATENKDTFFIQSMEVNQVTVVGVIRKVVPTVTHVIYSLDDMTGPLLDVKQWTELVDVNMNECVIPTGTYVKVVGSLRSFQHRKSLVALSIRCLEDFNEITSHMLEVVQARLLSDRRSCNQKNKASYIMNLSYSSDPATFGFTPNQIQVFNLIKSCPAAEGISVQSLRATLKSLSHYDIGTCLQFLINEGHIFSTVDQNHFKSTYV